MEKREFFIPFIGLKEGKHQFEYYIDITFFESFEYHEFNGASIKVKALLHKMSTMMELVVFSEGTINVNCDLNNEPFEQVLEST